MEWYEKLGFIIDPFDTKPLEQKPFIAKRIEKEIMYHIEAGNMLVLIGGSGMGKTTYMIPVIKEFGGEKKVIYFDCTKLRSIDMGEALRGATSERKLRKGMILLFDSIQKLTKYQTEQIKYYYDIGYIRAVIFTTDTISLLPGSLLHRIGRRIIEIPSLPDTVAKAIIQSRTGDKVLFTQDQITKLFTIVDKNPRELLVKCREVFRTISPPNYEQVQTEEFRKGLDEFITSLQEVAHAKALVSGMGV